MIINFSRFGKDEKINIKNLYNTAQTLLNLPSNLEINLVMVSQKTIKEMNKSFRRIDKITDVLSFPMLEDMQFLDGEYDAKLGQINIGDIYICKKRAYEQAVEYGHSYTRELCFLALHGLLHLLGYDHIEKEQEKEMFSLQNTILNNAKVLRD